MFANSSHTALLLVNVASHTFFCKRFLKQSSLLKMFTLLLICFVWNFTAHKLFDHQNLCNKFLWFSVFGESFSSVSVNAYMTWLLNGINPDWRMPRDTLIISPGKSMTRFNPYNCHLRKPNPLWSMATYCIYIATKATGIPYGAICSPASNSFMTVCYRILSQWLKTLITAKTQVVTIA
jgi:hypothetical protein